MGWYTYSILETDESWQLTVIVRKSKLAKVKRAAAVTRIALYTGDVTTDCVTVYMLYNYPVTGGFFGLFAWKLAILFMLLPILMTLIAVISDTITSTEHSILAKILLVPAIILCSPGIPLYFLILDAHDNFQLVPTGRTESKSAQARLNEALLEALPQAIIQVDLIMTSANKGNVPAWQIVTLTLSIVSFCFTLASSTYLFEAGLKTRLVFFGCSLVSVTSRLLPGAVLFIPTAILLITSTIVWFVKRVCLCSCCVPLANSHRQCNLQSILHVPITWVVTAYANCYTSSGLLLSTVTMAWSVFAAIMNQLTAPIGDPVTIYYITSAVLATATFLMNLVFVCVPKFRRSIGDAWFNKGQDGHAQLY